MGLVLTAVFTLILFGLGTSRYYLGKQVGLLEERRDTLRAENERLHQLRKQIAELEKVRRLRQSRLEISRETERGSNRPGTASESRIPESAARGSPVVDSSGPQSGSSADQRARNSTRINSRLHEQSVPIRVLPDRGP